MKMILQLKKDGSPYKIAMIPVFAIQEANGRQKSLRCGLTSAGNKKVEVKVPIDKRYVPLNENLKNLLYNSCGIDELSGIIRDNPNIDEGQEALVIVCNSRWIFFDHNVKLMERYVHWDTMVSCGSDYEAYYETLCAIMQEMAVPEDLRGVYLDSLGNALSRYAGSIPGAQGIPSDSEVAASILGILARIDHCRPVDIIHAPYQIFGKLANKEVKLLAALEKDPEYKAIQYQRWTSLLENEAQ